jgi:hypothetical protein
LARIGALGTETLALKAENTASAALKAENTASAALMPNSITDI